MRFFGNIKYRKILREFLIYILKSCFYLYILVHALFSFLYAIDYSVLEIYINVTVNSNSVRNYSSDKKMN